MTPEIAQAIFDLGTCAPEFIRERRSKHNGIIIQAGRRLDQHAEEQKIAQAISMLDKAGYTVEKRGQTKVRTPGASTMIVGHTPPFEGV